MSNAQNIAIEVVITELIQNEIETDRIPLCSKCKSYGNCLLGTNTSGVRFVSWKLAFGNTWA